MTMVNRPTYPIITTARAVVWPVGAHFCELAVSRVFEFLFCAVQRPLDQQLRDHSTESNCSPNWLEGVLVLSLYALEDLRSLQLKDHHFSRHGHTSLLCAQTQCQTKKSSDLQCVLPDPHLSPCLAMRDRKGAAISHDQKHRGVWLQVS